MVNTRSLTDIVKSAREEWQSNIARKLATKTVGFSAATALRYISRRFGTVYCSVGLDLDEKAQKFCKEYNDSHNPGRLSRKAEFTKD